MIQPELLLPVGDLKMLEAAIHGGADAVYIGVPGFNARGRSHDFEFNELKEMIQKAHLYGIRVFLAFNILIFEDELQKALETIKQLQRLQPDALIVQDLGLATMIKQVAPELKIHASTQMTVTNYEAIDLLGDLDIKRFVLGRENSIEEIKLIRQHTDKELEVFIHGALCVAYSGQCLTSENIGGRSANRGQCAQSCRFSYELFADDTPVDLKERQFLLSPQDLCGLDEVPELMRIGVESLKIEGRLKSPEYVGSSAKSYQLQIQKTLTSSPLSHSEAIQQKTQMGSTYSRGHFPGWLHGVNHQKLVDATYSNHRGTKIGTILKTDSKSIYVQLNQAIHLEPGDGLLWVTQNSKSFKEFGSFIFAVNTIRDLLIRVEIDHKVNIDSIFVGAAVYLNHDRSVKTQVDLSMHDRQHQKKIDVNFQIWIDENAPLRAEISDGTHLITLETRSHLVSAKNQGLSLSRLKDEFSSLGGTIYRIRCFSVHGINEEKPLFMNHREIKELRQELCNALDLARSQSWTQINAATHLRNHQFDNDPPFSFCQNLDSNSRSMGTPQFNLVLRNHEQTLEFADAYKSNLNEIRDLFMGFCILDFEFGRSFARSLEVLKSLGLKTGLATTRILKPSEYRNLDILMRLEPDAILVRNLGALNYLKKNNNTNVLLGDFSLNVANHLTANYLLNKGLSTVCSSYDLNAEQISRLLRQTDSTKLEVTIHQHMPSFHMEHCVFAAYLSHGTSYKDCGKPCEKYKVELKDQFNNRHLIKADQECRNTMFNFRSQTAIGYLRNWIHQGLSILRYEALHESGKTIAQNLVVYHRFLNEKISESEATKELNAIESYGLVDGSFGHEHKYRSRKKSRVHIP